MATRQTQKAQQPDVPATKTSNALVAPVGEVTDDMMLADAGAGLEGATADSYAIPFLSVLQKGSPQVDETSGVALEGAKAGMFYENVTGALFDGQKGVRIVPCAYRQVFLRWGPRGVSDGGGFKGELTSAELIEMRSRGEVKELDGRLFCPLPDGTINDKKCDRISDTRNHYVLVLDPETGGWTTALLSLTSTQIKKSKMLASMIASVKRKSPEGRLYQPASWANVVRMTSVPEKNDKGTWHGVRFELDGFVTSPDVYSAAKAFHDSVKTGAVAAKYEETTEEPAPSARF